MYFDEAMENLCRPDSMNVYDFPPPKMFEGCLAFLVEHYDDIESVFLNRDDNKMVETNLCFEKTKACLDEEL